MQPDLAPPHEPAVVIGLGASAGGVEALSALVARLPATLPAAVLVVLHMPSAGTSALPEILNRASPLPAGVVRDGEPLRAGRIYVAPPDRHLLVADGALRLDTGPRQNGHRPSVDATFVSLAAYEERAVGVLLSGTRDDGTRGMIRIKRAGGTALVQDPAEALFDGMIRSAQRYAEVDATLGIDALAARLVATAEELTAARPTATMDQHEMDPSTNASQDRSATRYTCPDCGGALWRHEDDDVLSFKCSVGHAYSPISFDGEQARQIENALWAAARLLGDRGTLLTEMAAHAESNGHGGSAAAFRGQAAEVESAAVTIQRLVAAAGPALEAVTPDQPRA